ncbi:MAG: polysulfide reductase NrfD [Anaerolineae bacterium]|nr:polysulfide reductase NrfD [Anaerolineae bacterium]
MAYNAQHKVPWHWPVPAYLVTKAIGAGVFMVLALGFGLRLFGFDRETAVIGLLVSLVFIAITTGLLVYDLERPERFFSILLRPQWKSWLTRGAFILVGFTVVAGIWWLLETLVYFGVLDSGLADAVRPVALWTGLALAVGAAIYTAFLFGQAEGRDLWQSSLLPFHLIVQALVAGSGVLLLMDAWWGLPESVGAVSLIVFVAAAKLRTCSSRWWASSGCHTPARPRPPRLTRSATAATASTSGSAASCWATSCRWHWWR